MSTPERTVKWPVKALWVFHVVMISLWSLPHAPPAVLAGRSTGTPVDMALKLSDKGVREGPLKYYLMSTGLWQYWDMFAPDPLRLDYYVDAVVRYEDGTLREAKFPRLADMPVLSRYAKERYRKYIERVQGDEAYFLQPELAQWIALQNFDDPKNPPVGVNIRRHSRRIPAPPEPVNPNRRFNEEVIYPSMVDQVRLYKAKGWTKP